MFAEVIPVVRLPNNLHRFDYSIPKKGAGKIKPGVLVTVPWRSKEIFGIVAKIKNTTEAKKTKEIVGLVNKIPLVPLWQLDFWNEFAHFYHYSEGTLAKTSLLPMQKRKIKKIELNSLHRKNIKPNKNQESYFNYAHESQRLEHIKKIVDKRGTHLYITAELHEAKKISEWLKKESVPNLFFHSDLSQKEKFDSWLCVRNAECKTVIGTRSALFLPFPNITNLILDQETNQHHKSWDSQPLYHSHDVIKMIKKHTRSKLHIISSLPSLATYAAIKSVEIQKNRESKICSTGHVKIISMDEERRKGNYSTLSDEVLDYIHTHKNDPLFFFLNRKGFSRALICKDCSSLLSCKDCNLPLIFYKTEKKLRCHSCNVTHPLTLKCPKCNGHNFKQYGAGTQQVEDELKNIIKEVGGTMTIIRIDSDREIKPTQESAWYVGTEYAFGRIPWGKLKGMIVIQADTMLALPDYTAAEQTFAQLMDFAFKMHSVHGELLIQTRSTNHSLFQALQNDNYKIFMDHELSVRQKMNYPPKTFLVRIIAEKNIMQIKNSITDIIKEQGLHIGVEGPYETDKQVLLLRFDKNMVQSALPLINKIVPPDLKVDPNPITLLG